MAVTRIKYKGLNDPVLLTSAYDMNSLLMPGVYYQSGTNAPANIPPNNPFNAAVVVLRGRAASATGLAYDCFQFWISNNARIIYFRAKYETWSPWQVLFSWSAS